MSASGRASFERFAGEDALASLPPRQIVHRRHRAAIEIALALHANRLVARLVERRWRVVHFEPVLGSLLLRWAVAQMGTRYAEVARGEYADMPGVTPGAAEASPVSG